MYIDKINISSVFSNFVAQLVAWLFCATLNCNVLTASVWTGCTVKSTAAMTLVSRDVTSLHVLQNSQQNSTKSSPISFQN